MKSFYYELVRDDDGEPIIGITNSDGLHIGEIHQYTREFGVCWGVFGYKRPSTSRSSFAFVNLVHIMSGIKLLIEAKRCFETWWLTTGKEEYQANEQSFVRHLPASENSDFYPTPSKLAGKMLSFVDCKKCSYVLEPSAGKGNLCDCLRSRLGEYRTTDIDCIESDANLRAILKDRGYRVVADDFLKFQTSKCYDLILMNPPFSMGAQHLLHAMQLLPMGGQIVCLLNAETIRNPYSNIRKELVSKLSEYGAEIEYVQDAFIRAERKTNVEVAIVSVNIPRKEAQSVILEQLHAVAEANELELEAPHELVGGDWVTQLVDMYKHDSDVGCALIREYGKVVPYFREPQNNPHRKDSLDPLISLSVDGRTIDSISDIPRIMNLFTRKMRLKYWELLFQQPVLTSRMTSDLQREYHQMVTELQDFDFSEFNIRATLTDISKQLTRGVHETLLNLFESCTAKYAYHAEFGTNIHYYNGWTTNKAYKVGKKVILPFYSAYYLYDKSNLNEYSTGVFLRDLEQSLAYLDGGLPLDRVDMGKAVKTAHDTGKNKVVGTYFDAILYKKGTCHIKFHTDAMPLIERLNIFAGREKNWLPPCYGKVHYDEMDAKSQAVIDSFQGRESYERVMADSSFYLVSPGVPALTAVTSA